MSDVSAVGADYGSPAFGFKLQKTADGWRWVAFDTLGRIADEGEAGTKVEAAARVIRALAKT